MLCLLSRRKPKPSVSMKSDLEGRNNDRRDPRTGRHAERLNEVRPRRPEQSVEGKTLADATLVSMKSGLEGRNNAELAGESVADKLTVSMKSGLEGRNNGSCMSGPGVPGRSQ